MKESSVIKFIGMKVTGQHGREIGVVTDLIADFETWQLQKVEVKLSRSTLDDLHLDHPWFGTQTVVVPLSEISGVTDRLVLNSRLEDMKFFGGKPADGTATAVIPVSLSKVHSVEAGGEQEETSGKHK